MFDLSHARLLAFNCLLATVFDSSFASLQTLYFTETPTDVRFSNTETKVIRCKANGRLKPKVSWLNKNGELINNVTGIRTVTQDGDLVFNSFEASSYNKAIHFNKYQCKVENNLRVLLSGPVQIEANVQTHVSVTSWSILSNGKEIIVPIGQSKDRFHALSKFGYLLIENIQKEDKGIKVNCTTVDALNKLQLTSTYAYLFVQDSAMEQLQIILSPINQIVKKQDTIIFSCIANSYPKPVYTWFKNGERLMLNSRYTSISSGVLILQNAEKDDSGYYKCLVTSGKNTQSKSMNVSVIEKISFTKKPESRLVQLGHSVRFSCKVTGSPAPSLSWLQDGKQISSNARKIIDRSVMSSELMLHMVSYKDEGIYQCVARNQLEEKYISSQLIVGALQPKIINKLEGRKVLQQDESLSLNCQATGQPLPKITWFVDGLELKTKTRFTISSLSVMTDIVTSTLKIDGLRMSDGGIYECQAENKAGITTSKSTLAVTGAPTIVGFKESVSATIGKSVHLDCNAKGFPLPTFKWFKDGWLNIANDNQYSILENGTLLISSVNKRNTGSFKCEAKNSYGQDQSTLMLNVLVPPTITPFKWASIEVGHRTSKTCEIPTGDLPIKITWYWNGKIIRNGQGVSVDTKDFRSHLTFTEVKSLHRGKYTCKAENMAGFAEHSEELVVNEPPRFSVSPSDTSVLKPASLSLLCRATGFPAPQIVWYKTIVNSRRKELLELSERIKQFRNGTLLVLSTSVYDSGKYNCKAENGIGKVAEKSVNVDIKVPATIIRTSNKIISQPKGSSATINCSASGTPVLQLNWYKSSILVTDSIKYKIRRVARAEQGQTKLLSTLTISNLQRADNGQYLCQSTNSFGGDTKSISVAVLERPDPPPKPTARKISSRWFEINWQHSYDGHCEITKYSLEYKRRSHSWGQKNVISVFGNLTRFIIAGIAPGISYNVRIIATNKIGDSDASEDAIFQTMEEAPSASPVNVSVSAIAKDQLRATWKPPPDDKQNGNLLGYYITCKEVKDPSQLLQRTVRDKLQKQFIIENLKPYTFYFITVQAFTKQGAGPASKPARKRTLEGAPSASPQSVTAVAISSQIIRVQWTLPPAEHRHGLIKGYKVTYTELTTSKVFFNVATRVHYAELTNLKKYTVYRINVLAYTKGGDGKKSKPILTRTAEDVPGPPEQLRAAAASPHEILVTWKPPSEPNGVITGYILHYRKSMDGSSSQHEFPLTFNANSQTLHGLEVGKEYEIWINAQTRIGTGIRTGLVKARTMTKIPARILTLTQIVRVSINADVSLPCVAVGHPKPDISWSFRNHKIKRRRHKRAYYNEGKLILNNVQLNNAGPYNCSAVNKYGSDWNIITLIVQGFPSTPYMLKAKSFNQSTVNISWVSNYDAHSPIIRYHIRTKNHNNSQWMLSVIGPERQWILIKIGSTNQTIFSVASENIIGVGAYSVVLEITKTNDGFVTRIISNIKRSIVNKTLKIKSKEKENMIAPIIAGCLVAVVVICIVILMASWDRSERRLRAPKCGRLFICDTHDDYPKGPYRGTYDGPYNEPNMPWPWNSTGNSFIATNENLSENNANEAAEEERFPEHLFAQLLNFDETDEDADKNNDENTAAINNHDLLAADILLGRSSSSTYKTSHSSQLSKNPFNDSTLLSSRNEQSTTDSENAPVNFASRSLESTNEQIQEKYIKPNLNLKLKHSAKSLDRGLGNVQRSLNKTQNIRNKTIQSANCNEKMIHTTSKSLSLRTRENKVARSKSVRSYESVSSTCSSTRGELVKAYEFGRKYRLQEYSVPPFIDNSTTEDSCSEISELCEFSSLPRDTNDCLLRMPIPIRPLLQIEDKNNEKFCKEISSAYNGESLV